MATKKKTTKSNKNKKPNVKKDTKKVSNQKKVNTTKKEIKVDSSKNKTKEINKVEEIKEDLKKEKKSFLKKINLKFFSKKKDKLKKEKKNKVKNKHSKKKDKKTKSILSNKNMKKILIIVSSLCGVIILIECIFLVSHYIKVEKNTTYYDMHNGIVVDDDNNILVVGQSDFRYSKKNSHINGQVKAKFTKYDHNGKIIFEKMYDKGTNTNFNSIIAVDDGYIVVGSGVFSDKEVENEGSEAIIIKYDKKGKLVWEKFYSVITKTVFNKVIEVEDGYIAIGQSIYANMEMGNHTTGGGIIVKYDKKGKELWHNNHGGTKSGNFNDIVKVGNDLYVVGKDGTDSGNLVKYSSDGKYLWHKNYRYTDYFGFTGVSYLDNGLYVVGSKKILPEGITDTDNRATDNTDCLLVKYDLEGQILFEKTFGGSNEERYNSILAHHNNLYIVGHTASRDAGLKITTDGILTTGIIVRYDINGNLLKKDVYGGSNNDTLTDITTDGVSLYVSGYSNSKDSTIKSSHDNGKDYFGKVVKANLKFKTLIVK